eukprot:349737-Chlamydomonas_euryale.AAC.2
MPIDGPVGSNAEPGSDTRVFQVQLSPSASRYSFPDLFRSAGSGSTFSATIQATQSANPTSSSCVDGEPPKVLGVLPGVAELPLCALATMHATLKLSDRLFPSCKVLVRHCTSGYLVTSTAESTGNPTEVAIGFSAPSDPGRVYFEVLDAQSGRLGAAATQLLLPSSAAAEELLHVSKPADDPCLPTVPHPVLQDVGLWIDTTLLDSRFGVGQHAKDEARRIGSALLNFCMLMRLDATLKMLTELSKHTYGAQPNLALPGTASVAPPTVAPTSWSLRQRRVRASDDSRTMLHGRSAPRPHGSGHAAVLPLSGPSSASLLNPSRSIFLLLQHCPFVFCAFSRPFSCHVSMIPIHVMFHATELLLVVMVAVRTFALPRLARILDSAEERVRPYFGTLYVSVRAIFCFAVASRLISLPAFFAPPSDPTILSLLLFTDIGCVFVHNPLAHMSHMYSALAVYGVSIYCFCRMYAMPCLDSAMVAAVTLGAASFTNMAHAAWLCRLNAAVESNPNDSARPPE